jgi:hypothetical protein
MKYRLRQHLPQRPRRFKLRAAHPSGGIKRSA